MVDDKDQTRREAESGRSIGDITAENDAVVSVFDIGRPLAAA